MNDLNVFARVGATVVAAAFFLSPPAEAADHLDGPAAMADPAADITDFLAWMSPDASKLRMALNVAPFATSDSRFSDAAGYVFHVGSAASFGEPTTEVDMICSFYSETELECWLGDEYVVGDASDPAGITSASGKVRVFAGPRNDPFFFEFTGFTAAVAAVVEAAPNLELDANGCPQLDPDTAAAIVAMLQSDSMGGPATDTFAGTNVLALVVELDVDLVNSGGNYLAAWGSVHQLAE